MVFPNLFKSPLYGKKTYPQKLWNGVESIALWLFCYGRLPSVWIVFGNNPVSIELRRRRGESRKGGSGGQAFCFWVNLTPRTSSKHNSMSIVLNTHSRKRKVEVRRYFCAQKNFSKPGTNLAQFVFSTIVSIVRHTTTCSHRCKECLSPCRRSGESRLHGEWGTLGSGVRQDFPPIPTPAGTHGEMLILILCCEKVNRGGKSRRGNFEREIGWNASDIFAAAVLRNWHELAAAVLVNSLMPALALGQLQELF